MQACTKGILWWSTLLNKTPNFLVADPMEALAAAAAAAAAAEVEAVLPPPPPPPPAQGGQPSSEATSSSSSFHHLPREGYANIERVGNGKDLPYMYECRVTKDDGTACGWEGADKDRARRHVEKVHPGLMGYHLYWRKKMTKEVRRQAHRETMRRKRKRDKEEAEAAAANEGPVILEGMVGDDEDPVLIAGEEEVEGGKKVGVLFSCSVAKVPGRGERRFMGSVEQDTKDAGNVAVTWAMRCVAKGLTRYVHARYLRTSKTDLMGWCDGVSSCSFVVIVIHCAHQVDPCRQERQA